MCGICGFVSSDPLELSSEDVLRRMCRLLQHRGPDDEGYHLGRNAGLGMRRLSIIDLETGQQPMTNETDELWVVFNGEIYNFGQLHARLLQKGHLFKTRSDTEVILHAFEEYGDDCVTHFNGMFAFALWDAARRRLLLARDHLGIKPLYYWTDRNQLVFGSELKALIAHPAVPREIDPVALDQFLTLEYTLSPRTIFKGVHKLPAGHRLIFQDGDFRVEQYWDIPAIETPADEGACAEGLADLIADAVRLQMISDVPLGAFLSGGIDSSTVVAFMSEASTEPVKTFSIGFGDASYNELPYARTVARRFHTEHHEEILEPEIAGLAETLVRHLDEPFGDFSIFPTYLVSRVARRSVKVVLSGDGGDELFGGYDTYVAQNLDRYYRWLPSPLRVGILPALMDRVRPRPAKKGVINKAKRFVEGAALSPSLQHARWMLFLSERDKALLYTPELADELASAGPEEVLKAYFDRATWPDPLAQQQYVDIKTYLVDDILTKVDRMSMAVSLEARVPLLDYRIAEFAVNLPAAMKISRGQTKRILRRAVKDRLPTAVLDKPKEGFSIPLKQWLRGPLKSMMTDLLSPPAIQDRGYFDPDCVSKWVSEHLAGTVNHSHRLWALMVFELWCQNVLESEHGYVQAHL